MGSVMNLYTGWSVWGHFPSRGKSRDREGRQGTQARERPAQPGPGKTLPVRLPSLGRDEAGRQEASPEWELGAAQARANPLEKGPRVVPG